MTTCDQKPSDIKKNTSKALQQCNQETFSFLYCLNVSTAKKYDIRELRAEAAVTREQALPAKCSGEEHGKPRSDYATQRPQHQEK